MEVVVEVVAVAVAAVAVAAHHLHRRRRRVRPVDDLADRVHVRHRQVRPLLPRVARRQVDEAVLGEVPGIGVDTRPRSARQLRGNCAGIAPNCDGIARRTRRRRPTGR